MNKNIFILAAVAAATAHADVKVAAGLKLYGVIDQAYTTQSVSSANSASKIYKNNGFFAAATTSKFGVKGDRNLNDNLKAVIQFEQELTPDEAELMPLKNRTAFVGLEDKTWGGVRLGTQETPAYVLFATDANGRTEYKPQLWRFLAGDPMQDRANNAIKFILPKFGPVNLEIMRGFGPVNAGGDFSSLAVNFQEEEWSAKAVWDSLSNTELKYALPGEPNVGVLSSKDTTITSNPTTMIAKSSSKPLQRAFAAVTYDMGIAKLNYIFGGAFTQGQGQVITNTVGIRVPLDQWTLALSAGMGSYTNADGNSGTATVAGKLSDITVGTYYNFDKSTTAYLLTSLGKNTPSVTSTNFTADVTGESKTTAVGLRYSY